MTGWVTAAGGAWNATIVAEYVTHRGEVLQTFGLGAVISEAATRADFHTLAAAVLLMSVVVVTFNRLVWRPTYQLAADALLAQQVRDAVADDSALCELRGVQKWFDRGTGKPLRVLEDINLELRPREVMCLIGPSGCGKSTILRICAGLIKPSKGEVRYHGQKLSGLDAGCRHRVPGLRALPLDDRARQCRGGAARPQRAGRRGEPRRAQRDPHGRPRGFRARLPARAVRWHEAAGRHGASPLGRPRDAVHGRAVQPGGCPDRRGPAGRDPADLAARRAQSLEHPDGQPRLEGGRLHGRPDRGALGQPGPDTHRDREPTPPPPRHALAGVPGARRSDPRRDHLDRAARRRRQHRGEPPSSRTRSSRSRAPRAATSSLSSTISRRGPAVPTSSSSPPRRRRLSTGWFAWSRPPRCSTSSTPRGGSSS